LIFLHPAHDCHISISAGRNAGELVLEVLLDSILVGKRGKILLGKKR
jgi:hypothetical protein